jgi:hypothetical protein
MIKALLLLFEPLETWEKIFREQRSMGYLLWRLLLPLLLLGCVAEGYGLHRWGKWQDGAQRLKQFSLGEAIVFETAQFLLCLLLVFIGAKMLKALGDTFHGRHSFQQTFTVAAYGLCPLFALRILDGFTAVHPLLTWSVGIVCVVKVLYQGIPRVMMPDPPHAFGLFLMSSVLLTVMTALARVLTWFYVEGRFKPLEQLFQKIGTSLFS